MTRETIREQASLILEDENNVFFTEASMNSKIQQGYQLAVLLSGCRVTSVDIDFIDDQVYYNIPTYASDFYRALAIYNNNTNQWLVPTTLRRLETEDAKWETTYATPQRFIPIGVDTIAFWPHLSVATGSFKLYYNQLADTLTEAGEPDIHSDLHKLLESFVASEQLAEEFEFIKASSHELEATKLILDLQNRCETKGIADRIIQHLAHVNPMEF